MTPRFISSHIASCNVFVALYNKSLNDWTLAAKPVNIVLLNIFSAPPPGNINIVGKLLKLPVSFGGSH